MVSNPKRQKPMKKVYAVYALVLALFFSCDEPADNSHLESTPVDSETAILVGTYYGMCIGEDCIQLYYITEDELFEDTNDRYFYDGYDISQATFVKREHADFLVMKKLRDDFPQQLLAETETFFGCPDCADGGGIYLQVETSDGIRHWQIDNDLSKIPQYLRGYVTEIREQINQLP